MGLELYGRADSSNVQRVLWALDELELEAVRHDVGGRFGGLDTPDYAALNPAQRVPTLVDGNLAIWESAAILRHLARREGRLWPTDPPNAARADIAVDWTQSTFWPAVRPAFQMVVHQGLAPDAGGVRAVLEAAWPHLGILDALLRDHHIAGPAFSLADIPPAVTLQRFLHLDPVRALPPAVASWWEAIRTRPAFAAHVWVA